MPKYPLIIAVAFALAGCESNVTDGNEDGDEGGASPCEDCQPAACPDSQPSEGAPCVALDLECEYEYLSGTDCDEHEVEVAYVCKATGWVRLADFCSEYIPLCPSELPVDGTPCDWEDDDAGTCSYDLESACEPSTVAEANCDLDAGVWQVTMPNGSCADCPYVSGAECAAASGCRWLVAPCDSLEPFEPYCAPSIDCAVDGCVGSDTCVDHPVNDCWASELEPVCCEGTAGVCEAPPPGKD